MATTERVGAAAAAVDSMIPSMPLRPAPPSDPPASRRGTLILNLALLAVGAVVVLSNLLYFPLGSGASRRSAEEKPPASAPVIMALPEPKQPAAPAESPPQRQAETAPAMPAPESARPEPQATLPQIEPSAAPPAEEQHAPPSEPAPPAEVVASLPPPTEPAPVTLPPQAAPVETASTPPSAPALSAGEIEALTRRGTDLLTTGDIIAARSIFERAARAGSATAATGVGKTFDPVFLAASGVRGIQGDPFEAAAWYRRGSAAGDPEAELRLRLLRQQFPQ
ncbi:MAG TPA: hypothetical protein VEC75_03410 [Stellaceae bacterium]|nr:hypothetical protein [Stellaceae bacterium]